MRVSPKIIIHSHPYSHIRTKLVVFAIQVNVAAAFGEEVRPTSVSQKKNTLTKSIKTCTQKRMDEQTYRLK